MNFFFLIFIILLLFATIGMLVVFYFLRKGIRYFRRFSTGDMSQEEFERMANKYYRKKENDDEQFDENYFKGKGWQQGQYGWRQQGTQQQRTKKYKSTGNITIEDRRAPGEANKKIFSRDEGEYVEFTEN